MAYPSRPSLEPLPQFAGTATSSPNPEFLERLVAFVLEQYVVHDRSLREIAELTDRSFSAIRNILDRRGVHRRPPGAAREPQLTTTPNVRLNARPQAVGAAAHVQLNRTPPIKC